MPVRPVSSPEYKLALEHAWAWFTVHAGQRMQLVNFWLIAIAFLTASLVTALTNGFPQVAIVVAAGGVVVTVSFHCLDRRTRDLVHGGERALLEFQSDLSTSANMPEMQILLATASRPTLLGSYSRVILALHVTTSMAFVAAGVYGAYKWLA